jgi:hypothetical protein
MGLQGPDLGHQILAANSQPSRRSNSAMTTSYLEPSRRLRRRRPSSTAVAEVETATVHRRQPTCPAWERIAPGREKAPPGKGLHRRQPTSPGGGDEGEE